MAHGAGREFDFRRVESDFERLISEQEGLTVEIGGREGSLGSLVTLLHGLLHAKEACRRHGIQKAFSDLVRASEPFADKSTLLDTTKR